MSYSDIAAAVRDVLHATAPDRGFPPDRDDECLFCGCGDGELTTVTHSSGTDRATAHIDCGAVEDYLPATVDRRDDLTDDGASR